MEKNLTHVSLLCVILHKKDSVYTKIAGKIAVPLLPSKHKQAKLRENIV